MSPRVFLTPGTIVADDPQCLCLDPEHIARHVFIGGGSGNGKSKLIELLCRQLADNDCGFTYIDPHGDGCEALLQHFALRPGFDPGRLHYLRPGIDRCFGFDPFAEPPPQHYESWLTATAARITDAFLRGAAAAEQDIQVLRKRWLENVLCACGAALDDRNTHVGLGSALVFTDPDHPEFESLLARVAPSLPAACLADFRMLREIKRPQDRQAQVGSTVNKLREILRSPVVRQMFNHPASISQKEVIRYRGIQLVNLRKSDHFSRDQGNIVGGLLINFLLHAAENLGETLPPEDRVPHYLIIDEAENYVGDDLRKAFAELRKFKLSVCLAVQDLSCLRKGELDLVGKVISQCGLQITFQQQNPDDIEFLAKAFGYGSLDLTPLMTEQVLPDGYKWVPTMSVSLGAGQSASVSESQTAAQSHGVSHSRVTSQSIQEQVSHSLSRSESEGHSFSQGTNASVGVGFGQNWGAGRSEADTHTEGKTEALTKQDSCTQGKVVTVGKGENRPATSIDRELTRVNDNETKSKSCVYMSGGSATNGTTQSDGHTTTLSENEGGSQTLQLQMGSTQQLGQHHAINRGETVSGSLGKGKVEGETLGENDSKIESTTTGMGKTANETIGFMFQNTPLAQHVIVSRLTGQKVVSVQDQLAELMNTLGSLPDRVVLVKCKGMGSPFVLRVHRVQDPYELRGLVRSAAWKREDLREFLARVYAAHPWYFVPKDREPPRRPPPPPRPAAPEGPAPFDD